MARERSRVASEGWGARLLDLQGADGHWGGAAFVPRAWISTHGHAPAAARSRCGPGERSRCAARSARVRERCTWGAEFGDSPFFEGEVEPCINGRVLAIGAYFGEASDRLAERLLQRAVERRRLELRRAAQPAVVVPLRRSACSKDCWSTSGRRVRCLRSPAPACADRNISSSAACSDRDRPGQIIDVDRKLGKPAAWTQCSFPTRWHYDILRALDYLRSADVAPDERIAEAVDLVAKKPDQDGRWPLENPHPGREALRDGRRAPASPVAGIRSGRFASSAGLSHPWPERAISRFSSKMTRSGEARPVGGLLESAHGQHPTASDVRARASGRRVAGHRRCAGEERGRRR